MRLLIFLAHAERRENLRLQLRFVNPDAAAAQLHAVQDDIVRFRAHLAELLRFEFRDVLGLRPGERMMHRVPFVFLGAESHERKVGHPEKVELAGARGQLLHLGNPGTNPAEHFADDFPFVRREQDEVAFFDLQF